MNKELKIINLKILLFVIMNNKISLSDKDYHLELENNSRLDPVSCILIHLSKSNDELKLENQRLNKYLESLEIFIKKTNERIDNLINNLINIEMNKNYDPESRISQDRQDYINLFK